MLRGNVLNDCGEPVSVALGMATVDPEAPASRVVSDPAQVRAQRRRSPVAGPEPRYPLSLPGRPLAELRRACATATRDAQVHAGRGSHQTTRGPVGPGVRQSKARSRLFRRGRCCSGVGAPDAQGDGGAADAVSAARWLRRNGRPVALARRPWVHRCRCSTMRPAAVARPRIEPLVGSGVRRRGCRRRRSAACR